MTNMGEMFGDLADQMVRDSLKVGDVHRIPLDQHNGITPKDGEQERNKYFIILGFDSDGNVIGGLVINSKINHNLPTNVTDYQLPVSTGQCPFLHHNSFVNCSRLITADRRKFSHSSYMGEVDKDLLSLIKETVKESPTVNKKQLQIFGIS
mgnify:CR=1 FL=1